MAQDFMYGQLASTFIEKIWHTENDVMYDFISTANSHSELVISRTQAGITVTVRGPETQATHITTVPNGEYLGIVFKLGTFMPKILPGSVANLGDINLPIVNSHSFWLDDTRWEIPTANNVDVFVDRLIREGLLVHDEVVSNVLNGYPSDLSPRATQYRFKRATGLTQKTIEQINRAQRAQALLLQGIPIVDIALRTGFYDQSHMTNALKRYLGQTPAQMQLDYDG